MLIERKRYIEELRAFRDKKVIKVITGVRRCGKSTLLESFMEMLLGEGGHNVIYLNFEDYDNIRLCDPDALYAYIKERLKEDGMNYIFLDEIQLVGNFARVVDGLFIKKNTDLYITGSNAYMLSGEIATMLSGRYVEISMLPLSFAEFLSARGGETTKRFGEYLEFGSMPYVLEFEGKKKETDIYLDSLYNTVILKDVMTRNTITDPMMLESVTRFIFDNVGNLVSPKKIADSMTSAGRKIDTKTVEKYLAALTRSFIVYRLGRYDIKGKQYLKTLDKYYAVDMGIRRALLGKSATANLGSALENIVCLELMRRGYKVFVGKVDSSEVDFVALCDDGIRYFQVSASVRDETTLSRELAPFSKIRDDYPKFLLTLDPDPAADYDGISRLNLLDWLLATDTTEKCG